MHILSFFRTPQRLGLPAIGSGRGPENARTPRPQGLGRARDGRCRDPGPRLAGAARALVSPRCRGPVRHSRRRCRRCAAPMRGRVGPSLPPRGPSPPARALPPSPHLTHPERTAPRSGAAERRRNGPGDRLPARPHLRSGADPGALPAGPPGGRGVLSLELQPWLQPVLVPELHVTQQRLQPSSPSMPTPQ